MSSNGLGGSTEEVLTSTCNSHCGGQCILKLHVREGTVVRVETDDGQDLQYRACAKGHSLRQRLYNSERLKWPMKRIGERGSGKFERIGWDEALDTVAGEMKRVRYTYGPAAIVSLATASDHGWMNDESIICLNRVLNRFGGQTGVWGAPSYEASLWAAQATYGRQTKYNCRDDLANSRLIIMWGWDPASSRTESNTDWFFLKAKEAGVRIVAVDPKYTDSIATFADQWIPIVPGTDAALLTAMAYVMVTEKLQDQRFLDTFTIGFDKYRDYLLGMEDGTAKTPEWANPITGVPAAIIVGLAREYATTKPGALIAGIGPGRTAMGEQFHRAAMVLAAMTGNVGVSGGDPGAVSYLGTAQAPNLGPNRDRLLFPVVPNPVDKMAPPRTVHLSHGSELFAGRNSPSSVRINNSVLADALLRGRSGGHFADYKLLFIVRRNLVTQCPNTNKIVQALTSKNLELIVVQEDAMSSTARFADILLPHSIVTERNDIAAWHCEPPFHGFKHKVSEPPPECKHPQDIIRELAQRLGIDDDFLGMTEDEYLRAAMKAEGVVKDFESFKKEGNRKYSGPIPSRIEFKKQIQDPEHNPFPTPSGKIEIFSQRLVNINNPMIPPVPKYIPTWEGRNDPLAKKYPLQLLTCHPKVRAHSYLRNIPWLKELIPQTVTLNTNDARARGIVENDMVRIFNDRGVIMIPATVTERIIPGVAEITEGGWFTPDDNGVDRGGCANVLTKDEASPCGAFACNTALVEVRKA